MLMFSVSWIKDEPFWFHLLYSKGAGNEEILLIETLVKSNLKRIQISFCRFTDWQMFQIFIYKLLAAYITIWIYSEVSFVVKRRLDLTIKEINVE